MLVLPFVFLQWSGSVKMFSGYEVSGTFQAIQKPPRNSNEQTRSLRNQITPKPHKTFGSFGRLPGKEEGQSLQIQPSAPILPMHQWEVALLRLSSPLQLRMGRSHSLSPGRTPSSKGPQHEASRWASLPLGFRKYHCAAKLQQTRRHPEPNYWHRSTPGR